MAVVGSVKTFVWVCKKGRVRDPFCFARVRVVKKDAVPFFAHVRHDIHDFTTELGS